MSKIIPIDIKDVMAANVIPLDFVFVASWFFVFRCFVYCQVLIIIDVIKLIRNKICQGGNNKHKIK